MDTIITVGETIKIRNAPTALLEWCANNLVIANPDYAKKVRMHLWTGNTPQKIYLYETVGTALRLPYGTLREILPLLHENVIGHTDFPPRKEIAYNAIIPLYDYQQEAVKALINAKYGILQSPAGSGKTQIGIALMAKLGLRTLWLTHTLDLLNQSKERAEQYIDTDLIGTITEGKVNIGKGVTFATVQTMCRLDLTKYRNDWDVIIVDECHRCSGTPTAMTQFYRVLSSLAARHKYGLSATVHRSDGTIKATYALLGQVVHEITDAEVGEKIMPVKVMPVYTATTLSREYLNTDGTINYSRLITNLCTDDRRNRQIVTMMMLNREHPSLILSDRLEHLSLLMSMLPPPMKEKAVMISGKTPKAEREQAIADMRSGKKKYLFATYSLAKEGLDIPCLERLFMGTPQKDYAVVTQSIGRIARRADGKTEAICYDFVDSIRYLARCYTKRLAIYKKNKCEIIEEQREK